MDRASRVFGWKWLAPILKTAGELAVDRAGRSIRTIHKAIELGCAGEIVGIFPEGGVAKGTNAAFRGGSIKGGACLIAIREGVPIVPCVVLGTEQLNRVGPWLPFKRAHVWVAYGEPIFPPTGLRLGAARIQMLAQLQRGLMDAYRLCFRSPECAMRTSPDT